MIYLIAGASHTGKTLLAQKMLEKLHYPTLSIDHLKMGLIRSKMTSLTPLSSNQDLTDYLWPIVKEIIKTAIENNQNLIVEGCYIPFNWKNDFEEDYLQHIKSICLVFSKNYIQSHFQDIKQHANIIEQRLNDECTAEDMTQDNEHVLYQAKKHNIPYVLIQKDYESELSDAINRRILQ